MLGASGAVGKEVLSTLIQQGNVGQLTLLGRSPIADVDADFVIQHKIDVGDADSYKKHVVDHTVAICTLGVGEPSKMSKEDFVRIDKIAVLDFAVECKNAGVKHFELLSSVGISAKSSSFFLRTKGELVEELKKLNFDRLSIFQPSMILTPTNRYGIAQAITLKVWPYLKPLLFGSLRKYRGIPVHLLGKSMALNIFMMGESYEILQWDSFYSIIDEDID